MDDDRSRRTNGRAPALPQILRQWATHHVGAFVEDADSSEHMLSSDYDGNALGAEARRAIHEEARRRGVRAKSVDLANGTRAVALTRRANEDEDEDGDETATRRRKARRVDDSDDTAEDDREDEEDARARELVGYVDLRETPFDVHAELKISKDNSNPAGRARAAYHREAIKWHPDNATPRRSIRRPSLFTPSVLEAPTRGRLSRKRRSRFERRAPGRVRTVVFSAPFDFAARPSPWRISSSPPSRAFGTVLISLDVSGRGSPCPARWVRSRRSRWTCTACTPPYSRARCSRASV